MALEIAAPLGSVNVPLIVEVDCAGVTEGWKIANPKRIDAARKLWSLIVPPLPLARELKVVPVGARRACEPGLRLRRSPGLSGKARFARAGLSAAFPSCIELDSSLPRTVAYAEKFRLTVARRRRLFTVFPCAESRVIVDGAGYALAPLAKLVMRVSSGFWA